MPDPSPKRKLDGKVKGKAEEMPKSARKSNQKTVAIISKPGRPELCDVLPVLEQWLQERNYAVVVDQESAVYFSASDVIARSELATRSPKLALVFGGDGSDRERELHRGQPVHAARHAHPEREDCRHARCFERGGGEQERDCALEPLRAFCGRGVRFQLPGRCADHRYADRFDRVFSRRGRADS